MLKCQHKLWLIVMAMLCWKWQVIRWTQPCDMQIPTTQPTTQQEFGPQACQVAWHLQGSRVDQVPLSSKMEVIPFHTLLPPPLAVGLVPWAVHQMTVLTYLTLTSILPSWMERVHSITLMWVGFIHPLPTHLTFRMKSLTFYLHLRAQVNQKSCL